jgi:hypothetical protein
VGSRGYEVGLWPNIKFDIIRAQAASPVSASPADLWQEQINVGREKRRSATSGSAAPALSEAKPLPHLQQGREIRVASLTLPRFGSGAFTTSGRLPTQKESIVLPTRSFVSSARRHLLRRGPLHADEDQSMARSVFADTERSKAYPLRFRLRLPENCRSVPVGTERDHWCRSTGCTRS